MGGGRGAWAQATPEHTIAESVVAAQKRKERLVEAAISYSTMRLRRRDRRKYS